MSEPRVSEVADDVAVAFLLDQPGLLDLVLAEHVNDGTGSCAACPGPQSGRRRWPCNVRLLAARAQRARTARADGCAPEPDAPAGT